MYIVRNLVAPAVVYPAVADRVGLLAHPQATVNFYMRLSEAKALVDSFVRNSRPDAPANVTPALANNVADCLLTALHLAIPIVGGVQLGGAAFVANIQNTTLGQINECLQTARTVFPNADIFQGPAPGIQP